MENKKELLTKIGKIQDEISSLIKDEKNKNLYYKYFEESQLLKILKPLLEREKLTMIIYKKKRKNKENNSNDIK
jgi:hypothetical protein